MYVVRDQCALPNESTVASMWQEAEKVTSLAASTKMLATTLCSANENAAHSTACKT